MICNLQWAVRRIVGNIAEKRLTTFGVDEIDRLIRQIIDDIAVGGNIFAVFNHLRIKIIIPVTGAKTGEFIKPLSPRIIGILLAIMPLPKHPGAIAVFFEHFRNCHFLRPHDFFAVRYPGGPGTQMIAAGEQTRPGGGANRADIEAVQNGAFFTESIDGRSLQ